MRNDSPVLAETAIDERVFKYFLVGQILFAIITLVGIPLLPFVLPLYWYWFRPRYPQYYKMALREKSLTVLQGVVFRREIDVPLERITDVTIGQGPLQRWAGVYQLTIETAGQTRMGGTGNITGIVNPHDFRKAILDQREKFSTPRTS